MGSGLVELAETIEYFAHEEENRGFFGCNVFKHAQKFEGFFVLSN